MRQIVLDLPDVLANYATSVCKRTKTTKEDIFTYGLNWLLLFDSLGKARTPHRQPSFKLLSEVAETIGKIGEANAENLAQRRIR